MADTDPLADVIAREFDALGYPSASAAARAAREHIAAEEGWICPVPGCNCDIDYRARIARGGPVTDADPYADALRATIGAFPPVDPLADVIAREFDALGYPSASAAARAAREHIAAEIEADAAHLLPGMTHRDEMEDAARIARGRP
jgi:hypothetical protein